MKRQIIVLKGNIKQDRQQKERRVYTLENESGKKSNEKVLSIWHAPPRGPAAHAAPSSLATINFL